MKKHLSKLTTTAGCLAAILFAGQTANAVTFGFSRITANSSQNVASQLSVDVTAGAGGTVNFTFFNNVGIASSITDIYFDDGTLLAIASISDSGAGVAFAAPASPGDMPGGNSINPPFVTTQGFSADSDAPVMANGVSGASEWITINFTLQNGQTFADTLAALASGALRIGLHVQAIGNDGLSDSFVSPPPGDSEVPDGGTTLLLLGSALTGLGVLRRKFASKLG